MTRKEINRRLELHKKWLNGESDGEKADFSNCDLEYVDFSNCNLEEANFENTNLKMANFENANLKWADLCDTNLEGANLKNAILQDTILIGAENIPYIPMVCPEQGSFKAWKKVVYKGFPYLIELLIPEDARRSSATGNKCRCNKAKVISITNLKTNEIVDSVINNNYVWDGTEYKVGEMVYPDSFDEDRWQECSNGIHFFMDKQEAINYVI